MYFISLINSMRAKARINKGFTLIELLVVIAIIGILAGIVLVSLNNARESARDTKRISDMRSAALALELYYAENAEYVAAAASTTCENFSAAGGLNTELGETFDDPSTGANYMYGVDDSTYPQDYVILATLEGTPDILDSANDADGTVLGCTCDDPDYCLQP